MKYLFSDVETSGLDPTKHAIIQLSGIIEIDDVVVEEFDFKMQPFPGQLLSNESLSINGVTVDQLKTFPKPKDVYNQIIGKFNKYIDRYNKEDKFIFVGYNSNFDDSFLRQFFKNCGDDYYSSYIWWPTVDVAPFAMEFLKEYRHKFPNFKLATIAKALEIEVDDTKTHNAMYDTQLTRKIYRKLILGVD